MGCAGSKNDHHRREADEYAKRKKMGFKDPGLEKFRKDAVRQKKKLKRVEDPDKVRKQKLEGKTATVGGGSSSGGGGKGGGGKPAGGVAVGAGLTEDEINAQRNKLKKVKR